MGDRPLCRASAALLGEESTGLRRRLQPPRWRAYAFSGEVLPRDGRTLERLLANPTAISASASSRAVSAPEGRPGAAVDNNLSTGLGRVRVRRRSVAQAQAAYNLVASTGFSCRPTSSRRFAPHSDRGPVRLGRDISAPVDDEGYVRFTARSARTLDLAMERATGVTNIEAATGLRRTLPVGLSEVRVLGADDLRGPVDPTQQTGVPCGFGPTLVVDGGPHLTRVRGPSRTSCNGDPCDGWPAAPTRPGRDSRHGWPGSVGHTRRRRRHQRVRALSDVLHTLRPRTARRQRTRRRGLGAGVSALARTDPATMRLTVGERSLVSVLTVAQNFNEGWSARDARGTPLVPIRLDGWKQGWVLPPSAADRRDCTVCPPTARIALGCWWACWLSSAQPLAVRAVDAPSTVGSG